MDISSATAIASAIVALVAPALVQAFKRYIPADFVGLVSLGVSVVLGVVASTGTVGASCWPASSASRRRSIRWSIRRSTANSPRRTWTPKPSRRATSSLFPP